MLEFLRRLWRTSDPDERWIVLDVETSGLDVRADALLAVGAVAMRSDGTIVPHDSVEIVLRQASPSSRENIVVHGIGGEAQLGGVAPLEAMQAVFDYAGSSPVLAFHAPFDRAFIDRAAVQFVGRSFDNAWLDLAELAPALEPKVQARNLDDWLAHCGIDHEARHSAAGDAFATAQLAAHLLRQARVQGARRFRDLQALARSGRWVG